MTRRVYVLLPLIGLVLALGAGCQSPAEKELREQLQREKHLNLNLEQEIQDLLAQIEKKNGAIATLNGRVEERNRMIQTLKDGLDRMRGVSRIEDKVRRQLEILANRLGGELVDNRLRLPGSFFFASGQYDLRGEAKGDIQELVKILQADKGRHMLLVVGHTDTDPIKNAKLKRKGITTNRHLSLLRGMTVLNALKAAGYDENLIYPTGWGALKPAAPNTSTINKAANRRVEIYIDPVAEDFFGISAIEGVVGGEGQGVVIEK